AAAELSLVQLESLREVCEQ
nr:RecName: Full=Osteocalcin; AltName: Full=Bone Gla protein; Short=BGP; AltName: Full=Gamma-carboxyglutamic acid-containing protein [Halobatrachus didactylus]